MTAEWQKLIRIADRPELGWSVVAEYNGEDLADDSEDEKRLEKAEQSTERKATKRKKKCRTSCRPPGHTLCVQSSYWNHSFVRHADGLLPGPEATRNDSL